MKFTKINTLTGLINKIKSSLNKETVGLGNVDNTSDINKPVSTAMQTALDGKLSVLTLQSGTYNADDLFESYKNTRLLFVNNNYTLNNAPFEQFPAGGCCIENINFGDWGIQEVYVYLSTTVYRRAKYYSFGDKWTDWRGV